MLTWKLHGKDIELSAQNIVKKGPKQAASLLITIASTSNWHFSVITCLFPLLLYFIIVQFFPGLEKNDNSIEYVSIELTKAVLLLVLMSLAISHAITFLQTHYINPVGVLPGSI